MLVSVLVGRFGHPLLHLRLASAKGTQKTECLAITAAVSIYGVDELDAIRGRSWMSEEQRCWFVVNLLLQC